MSGQGLAGSSRPPISAGKFLPDLSRSGGSARQGARRGRRLGGAPGGLARPSGRGSDETAPVGFPGGPAECASRRSAGGFPMPWPLSPAFGPPEKPPAPREAVKCRRLAAGSGGFQRLAGAGEANRMMPQRKAPRGGRSCGRARPPANSPPGEFPEGVTGQGHRRRRAPPRGARRAGLRRRQGCMQAKQDMRFSAARRT